MRRRELAVIIVLFLVVSFSVLSFAQEEQSTHQPAASSENSPAATEPPAVSAGEAEMPADSNLVPSGWLYGEVDSVDIINKNIVLTYLDYDTDIEKQATIHADAKTVFENVKSLEEIKPQDMVSIDYVVGTEGSNLAVNISVEKPEGAEDLNIEPQVPEETGSEMKPAVEIPAAAPALESPEVPAGEIPAAAHESAVSSGVEAESAPKH